MNFFNMCRKKTLVFTLFSIYLFLTISAQNASFPAIFAFGDSILDTGNNNYLLTVVKSNHWPYGSSFHHKMPTGRFGNGRVFSDVIAETLEIKDLVPAYHQFHIANKDFITGVSFASGGSGIDDATPKMLGVLSVEDQLKDFKNYLKTLKKIVKDEAKVKHIISNALFLVGEGTNDIGITFFATPTPMVRPDSPDTYTTKMVGWTRHFLKELYDLGARKFAVMGVLPIGCMPMHRLLFGGFLRWCNVFLNNMSQDFNKKLQKDLQSYGKQKDFCGAKFVYVDIYTTLMDIINHRLLFGFKEVETPCCCMITAIIPCSLPEVHVFYDGIHPSENAYYTIAGPLAYDIKTGLA